VTPTRPASPTHVRAAVVHRRTRPFRYEFAHRTSMWLVDVVGVERAFPRWVRPLASIRSEDHFGPDDVRPLEAKVREYLAGQHLTWSADTVLMLTNARSFGYVFDPLTTYFCFDAAGRLEGVLAEVHNTYGERHCYPLDVREGPSTSVDKEFYVSPFFAVEGRYDIRTRLSPSQVSVAIALSQGDRTVFTASVRGELEPTTPWGVARAVVRDPFPSHRVSALIRWHGIRLWLRRLPVVPRRPHQAPEGLT
jgi:uncharacterized protein